MKKLLAALLIAITGISAYAGDGKTFKNAFIEDAPSLFRDKELQIDGFFLQTFAGQTSGQTINTGSGGGFAVNAIFCRYLGVGVENAWFSNDNRGDYLLGAYGIVRYPIESLQLAPYALAGGGAGFGRNNYGYGSLGLGFEHRWTPNLGAFVDGRWFYGAPDQVGALRSGLRVSF